MGKPKSEVTGLDSGWSWIIAAACCFVNCMLYGAARLSGMLLQPAVETFGVSRGEAAVPFTTSSAVRNLSGPIVGFLGQQFGIQPVAAAGCILAALGSGLCFFATDIIWTTVFWGVIYGIGLGLSTSLLPSAITENFKKNAATASGISYAGSFVGSFMFPPLVQFLLDNYDLPRTFLILSGFILSSLVAVVLLRPPCMPRSPSNSKPIYTINTEKNVTECDVFQQVIVDDSVKPNVKCRLSGATDHPKPDVENNGNSIYQTTNYYGTLDIKALSKSKVPISQPVSMVNYVLPEDTESSRQFLGFLAFSKNFEPADCFTAQKHFKVSSEEKQNFTNFLFREVVQRIREHVTQNENHKSGVLGKSAKRNEIFLEFSDSQRNVCHVSQLSDHNTTTLIRKLRDSCDQSDSNNLSKKYQDVILLAISQDVPIINGTETSIGFQTFTKWQVIRKNTMLDHSQNRLKRDEMQVPNNRTVTENSTSKSSETWKSIFLHARNNSLLSRLTRSFKHKTSTARTRILRKALSLDSKDENSQNVESPCSYCRTAMNATHTRTNNESENAFTDPNHNNVSLENANELMTESKSLQCNCVLLNNSVSQMNNIEGNLNFDSMPDMTVYLNREKFLNDVPPGSEGHLLQSSCAAILLLRSTHDNRACLSNPKILSNSASEGQLNNENRNISVSFPDQNQNFLDANGVIGNTRHSKTGDYLEPVMNADDSTRENYTFKRRLRSWCSVFSNPMFLLISATMAVFSFIMVCIITIIEDYTRDIGHSHSPKPYVLMVLSAAALSGTLGLGWITDRRFVTKKNFIAICFFGMATSIMAIAFTTEVITLCALVAIYGLFESGVLITFPLVMAQFIRADKQTIAIASSNLLSAPVILLVPVVIGYFRDYLGSYHKLFCVLSVTSSVCGFLWLLVPFLLQKYSLKFKGGIS